MRGILPKPTIQFKDKKKEKNKNECRKKNSFLNIICAIASTFDDIPHASGIHVSYLGMF